VSWELYVTPFRGFLLIFTIPPTTYVVGYVLPPLRGFGSSFYGFSVDKKIFESFSNILLILFFLSLFFLPLLFDSNKWQRSNAVPFTAPEGRQNVAHSVSCGEMHRFPG
jgi:hypothetical protein